MAGTDDKLTEYIKKDGTTETTAAIPFAAGVKTGSITGLTDEGVAIEAPLDLNLHQITGVQDATDPMGAVNLSQMQTADAAVLAEAKQYTDEHGIPAGGTTGQVLAKSADTDYTVAWTDPQAGSQGPAGPGVAAGGTAGQVLAKVDGTDYNTHWIDAPSGPDNVPHLRETWYEAESVIEASYHLDGKEFPSVGFSSAGEVTTAQLFASSELNARGITVNSDIGTTLTGQPDTLPNDESVVTKKHLDTESANTLAEAKSYTDDKIGSIQISGIQSSDKVFAINNTGAVSTNMTSFNPMSDITVNGGGHQVDISDSTVIVNNNAALKVSNIPSADDDAVNKAYVDNPKTTLLATINKLGFYKTGNIIYAKYTDLVYTSLTDIGTPVFAGTKQYRQVFTYSLTDIQSYLANKKMTAFSVMPTSTLAYTSITPTIRSNTLNITVVTYQSESISSTPSILMPYNDIIAMWI